MQEPHNDCNNSLLAKHLFAAFLCACLGATIGSGIGSKVEEHGDTCTNKPSREGTKNCSTGYHASAEGAWIGALIGGGIPLLIFTIRLMCLAIQRCRNTLNTPRQSMFDDRAFDPNDGALINMGTPSNSTLLLDDKDTQLTYGT